MKKPDFYLHIHKAIRRRLYLAAISIGTTDFEDSTAIKQLRSELESLFALLRRHAEHENHCFHPLLRRIVPDLKLDEDHTEQERTLTEFERLLNSVEHSSDRASVGAEFYSQFNEFVTHSLEHMRDEENLMPRLREEFETAELVQAMQKVFASFTPAEIADSATYFPQALNPKERALFGF